MKQASLQQFHKFSSALIALRSIQSTSDHSLFIKHQETSFLALLVYVDDIIFASNDTIIVEDLKMALDNKKFRVKDLGPLKYFLGLEVALLYFDMHKCTCHE